MSKLFILAVLLFLILAADIYGQTGQPNAADKSAIASLWNEIIAAVRKKDRLALEQIYADDFTHVHAQGKIDDRKARIDTLLSGESTIDTGGEIDFGLRKYADTMIAVGTVKITADDGKAAVYAVTKLYVRRKDRWVYASGHASPVVN